MRQQHSECEYGDRTLVYVELFAAKRAGVRERRVMMVVVRAVVKETRSGRGRGWASGVGKRTAKACLLDGPTRKKADERGFV
jgi:hypothetical protein